jgi:uncharacterized Zn finger protein
MQQQRKPINIRLDQTLPVVCEHCGSETFTEGLFLRKVSRILTGAPQDTFQPVPTFLCAQCGKVNKEFTLAEAAKNED